MTLWLFIFVQQFVMCVLLSIIIYLFIFQKCQLYSSCLTFLLNLFIFISNFTFRTLVLPPALSFFWSFLLLIRQITCRHLSALKSPGLDWYERTTSATRIHAASCHSESNTRDDDSRHGRKTNTAATTSERTHRH